MSHDTPDAPVLLNHLHRFTTETRSTRRCTENPDASVKSPCPTCLRGETGSAAMPRHRRSAWRQRLSRSVHRDYRSRPVHAPSAVHAHVHVNDHGHVDERESRIAWTLTWSCTCSSSSVAHVAVFMKQSARVKPKLI